MRDVFTKWASDSNIVVLDTETTGLSGEILELAIVDLNERVIFNSRIRPLAHYVEPGAFNVHGISDNDLVNAPSLGDIYPEISEILRSHTVLVYNQSFDRHRFEFSAIVNDIPETEMLPRWRCVMLAYADFYGEPGRYSEPKWQRLFSACQQQGVNMDDLNMHSALGDAMATARLIRAVGTGSPVGWHFDE